MVGNYHMAFMLHKDSPDSKHHGSDEAEDMEVKSGGDPEELTFLYQCVSGAAGRSYGLNVARLADIPQQILSVAAKKSHELEQAVSSRV